jgi:lipopolysaccharide transport system ATP-binding protein
VTDTVIRVQDLAKSYAIGENAPVYGSLRESLENRFKGLVDGKFRSGSSKSIWALRDVSFEVKRGSVVGIIGRNGAGKSTLLKILSRITRPTSGKAIVRGRVGSMLEVGTGFHPELTGRENIYLNGAILGMKRSEIDRKFDEMVAFAGIEEFLDTPVKRYSSGMFVRLAFAVSAHLDMEILLVDEVLAVGDIEFQKKCLGKMGEVATGGRTVLLVSHQMAAISRTCNRVLLLESGKLDFDGPPGEAIERYISNGSASKRERVFRDFSNPNDDGSIRFRYIRICDSNGNVLSSLDNTKDFFIEIGYELLASLPHLRVGIQLATTMGVIILDSNDQDTMEEWEDRTPGFYISRCRIPGLLLNQGLYQVNLIAHIPRVKLLFFEEGVISFHVTYLGNAGLDPKKPGVIRPSLDWSISRG